MQEAVALFPDQGSSYRNILIQDLLHGDLLIIRPVFHAKIEVFGIHSGFTGQRIDDIDIADFRSVPIKIPGFHAQGCVTLLHFHVAFNAFGLHFFTGDIKLPERRQAIRHFRTSDFGAAGYDINEDQGIFFFVFTGARHRGVFKVTAGLGHTGREIMADLIVIQAGQIDAGAGIAVLRRASALRLEGSGFKVHTRNHVMDRILLEGHGRFAVNSDHINVPGFDDRLAIDERHPSVKFLIHIDFFTNFDDRRGRADQPGHKVVDRADIHLTVFCVGHLGLYLF